MKWESQHGDRGCQGIGRWPQAGARRFSTPACAASAATSLRQAYDNLSFNAGRTADHLLALWFRNLASRNPASTRQ